MSGFLFTAWPYAGCLYPQLSVACALAERGHRVAFYTGEAARALVERAGFTHIPFQPRLDRQVNELLLDPEGMARAWQRPWQRPFWLRRFLVDTVPLQVEDLDVALARWSPDAIITEPAFYAPFLVLQDTHHVPVAILEYSFTMVPGPDVPPAGLGWRRARTWPQRLGQRLGERAVRAAATPIRVAASEVRRRYGLAPLGRGIHDVLERVPLVLVPSCREFDFDRSDLPASVQYVGACQWFPPRAEPAAPDPLASLAHDRPWVHVTEGTLYPAEPILLKAAAQGLAMSPVRVIMSTGTQRPGAALAIGRIAPNTMVAPWVEYRTLLPRTDAVVTIGGGGTVLAALAAGIPLVVVPMMWDHADNAARVVDAGAGVRLSPRRCTPRRLRDAVRRVLDEPAFRANARRVAAALKTHPGPSGAARHLERLAS